MTPSLLVMVLTGLCFGAGLWCFLDAVVRPQPSVLERRLAALLPETPDVVATRTKPSVRMRVSRWLGQVLGGAADVRERMERAGLRPDVDAFRASQAIWGMTALLAAAVIVTTSSLTNGTSPTSAVLLLGFAGVSGVIVRDQLLTRAAVVRERQMVAEFPAIADMLALAVAAGQGPLGALDHVTTLCHGPLAQELNRALHAAASGVPLADALAGVARRTSLVAVSRFIDGMIVALERGTPLAEVLRAQAQDARAAARGELIESAGRKEVLMMAPIVFLTLPTTIVFAVFPGLSALNLSL